MITYDLIDEITDNIDKGLLPEPLEEPTEEEVYELTKDEEHFFKYLPYLISVATVFNGSDIVAVINNVIDKYVVED